MTSFARLRSTESRAGCGVLHALADDRGAAMTEYVVLLGAVGIGVAAAIAALGPSLVASYDRSRTILVGPMP